MLAERIAGLCEAVQHCRDDSPLMDLLVANLPILLAFLHVSPALPFDVTLPYEPGCTLRTTAGCVRRCGIVKIMKVIVREMRNVVGAVGVPSVEQSVAQRCEVLP